MKLKTSGLSVISLAVGLLMAYSVAVHYFVWFSRPRTEKIGILLICVLVCVVAVSLVLWALLRCLSVGWISRGVLGLSLLFSFVLTLFWLRNYAFVPFQTNHKLVIYPISTQRVERSGEAQVELRGIFLPNGQQVNRQDITLTGRYFENGGVILLIGEDSATYYQAEFLGDMSVELRSGPVFDAALIEWDGARKKVDVFSETDGIRKIQLSGKSFGDPRLPWRVLAYMLYVADFVVVFFAFGIVVFVICAWGIKIYHRDGLFWPVFSFLIVAAAGISKALAPTGSWVTRILGAEFWYTNDPEGAYFGSAMHLFGPERYPPFAGHPGLPLQLLLYVCSRVFYGANVFRGATVSVDEFIARHQSDFFVFCSSVLGFILVLGLYLLYLLTLDLTASKTTARLSSVAYATSFPVLFFISRISVEYLMVLFYLGALLAVWRAEREAGLKNYRRAFIYIILASLSAVSALFTKIQILGLFPAYLIMQIVFDRSCDDTKVPMKMRGIGVALFVVFALFFSWLFVQKVDVNSFSAYWVTYGGLEHADSLGLMGKLSFVLRSGLDNFSTFLCQNLFLECVLGNIWCISKVASLSEYAYFVMAAIGLVLYLRNKPRHRSRTIWLLGYLLVTMPILFYRLVFHYWFIHLVVAAVFVGYAVNVLFSSLFRFFKWKIDVFPVALAGVLVVHLMAILFFVDGKYFDTQYYRKHVSPYKMVVSSLGESEKFGLLYDGRVSSPSTFDYHGVYEVYTPPNLPIQKALNDIYVAISIEDSMIDSCTEAAKQGVDVLLDTRETPAKVIHCR
ncbi:MAG: hypothetical protein HPY45_10145 [Anaerolineae bacterium]|nr:hypothetical protein [Anaerolineae bacterium]